MKILTEKNRIFELLMIPFLTIVFLRNALEITTIPSWSLLVIAALIAVLADRNGLLAFAICCAPLSSVFQYKYALLFIIAAYILRFSRKIRINFFLIALFVFFFVWESLHASVYVDFSYIEFFRSLVEILFLLFVMNNDYPDLDYGRIVRALAISVVVVCVAILVYQIRSFSLSEIAHLRFGTIKGKEDSEFMASFNPNVLNILCILPIVCLSQLIMRKESKFIDIPLIATLAFFTFMTMSIKVIVLGAVLLLLLILDQRNPGGVLKWVILFAAAIAIVYAVLNSFFPEAIETFSARFEKDDLSNGRIDLLISYHHYLFKKFKNMFFGIGLQDNLTRLTAMGFVNVPHNGLQELLVVWGVPGFVAFLILLGSFFKFAGKKKGEQEIINLVPFIIMLVFVQFAQMVTSGRYLLLFTLAFLSMRYTFKRGKRQKEAAEVAKETEQEPVDQPISQPIGEETI